MKKQVRYKIIYCYKYPEEMNRIKDRSDYEVIAFSWLEAFNFMKNLVLRSINPERQEFQIEKLEVKK